ncbi:glycine betaine ABC transporter substrate-binding protein [Candidatus Spongiihabitans sp.]|uniref:glycine betaine ABC transporter substrate-binding protein n=1 Tax=Candidatus Spongiihabitans sp. TaxID=3101308 RepID=UPI003C6F1835
MPGKNVEWLEVPYTSLLDDRKDNTTYQGKNLGFAVDSLRVVANNDFLKANPAAKKLFEATAVNISDVSAQNSAMCNGEDSLQDISRHVDKWMEENQSTFNSWLEAARS